MFGRRKKQAAAVYDKINKILVTRSGIFCTGEQVTGFKDLASGKFEELMLLHSDRDLQEFLREYQVDASEIKQEW